MNGNCYDIGTIQAFLDGEVTPQISAAISDHISMCDDCSLKLAAADEENAFVFAALDREMDALVPTQRLWSKINESIEIEKSREPFWARFAAFVSATVATPSMAVAAGLLMVFSVSIAVWSLRSGDQVETASATDPSPANRTSAAPPTREIPAPVLIDVKPDATVAAEDRRSSETRPVLQKAVYRPAERTLAARAVNIEASAQYISGEESYVKTIADLKNTVDKQKDFVLDPRSRVAYERDLAVVNDAIGKMKQVVKKDPANQTARQLLLNSYQNKVDLLNSVAEKEELMASLR